MGVEFAELCQKAKIENPVLIFLGGGKMADALVSGAVSSGFAKKEQIVISVRSTKSATKWKDAGYEHVFTSNVEMLEKFDKGVLLLCVKPQVFPSVVADLPSLSACPLIVSIMAGISTKRILEQLSPKGYKEPVVRLMPSAPCSVQASASLVCSSGTLPHDRMSIVTGLAEKVGTCTELDEGMFNAAASVAACSPAFVCILIEGLADGGVLAGLPRETALKLATQAFLGTAKLVASSESSPAVVKDQVCSAGGTTIAGIRELERAGVRSAMIEAIRASTDRANSM